jgi:hypothetical protein
MHANQDHEARAIESARDLPVYFAARTIDSLHNCPHEDIVTYPGA